MSAMEMEIDAEEKETQETPTAKSLETKKRFEVKKVCFIVSSLVERSRSLGLGYLFLIFKQHDRYCSGQLRYL
jgi:hypothetical protein